MFHNLGGADDQAAPAEHYGWEAFRAAFSVVLAHSIYLPTAECLALLPLAGLIKPTASDNGCDFDYDVNRQAATLVSTQAYRCRPAATLVSTQAYRCRPAATLVSAQACRCRPAATLVSTQAYRCHPAATLVSAQAYRCRPAATLV